MEFPIGAAMGLAPAFLGQRQVVDAPPPPQFGGGPQMGGLLGPSIPAPGQGLEQFLTQQAQAMRDADTDPVGTLTANQPASQGAGAKGPPAELAPEAQGILGNAGQMAGGFFGNLDQTFQSPSKAIGIGLLGRMNPALGAAGLLAGGLLGPNKVF